MASIQRNALSRGTAVHLGGDRVRFIWACGCTKVEAVRSAGPALSESAVQLLVRHWRRNGVVLEQCHRHPDWHCRDSQVASLNLEWPCPPI